MEKRLFQLIALTVFLIAIGKLWNPLWSWDLDEAVDSSDDSKIVFTIEKGSNAKQIANDLEENNLIVSDSSFVKDVEKNELDGALRYGSFVLSPSMTLEEIVTILTTEGTGEMALTVPEGWTVDQIDAKLTDLGLISAGEFKTCTFNCELDTEHVEKGVTPEGYLFPDTYFIDSASFSNEGLLNQMLQNFDSKWTDDMQKQLEASGHSLKEVVTVASMLEKEVRTEEDLPIVAGIIWKRLANDWALGIDATLLYKDADGSLSSEDLASDSPYNTRVNKGLPPTAIGNPGLATLMAALNPEESDYWFYLTDSEGAVHYATTNEEHEANKAQYLN